MPRFVFPAVLTLALIAGIAGAQPTGAPDQAVRAVNAYVYMMDGQSNKVLVSTQFWRNDPKYDDRAFHRFLDAIAAVEKRGFRKDDKAVIDNWEKKVPFARCYVYLEDLQAGRKTKGGVTTGTRVWCAESGVSEVEVDKSDAPKHVEQVLQRFDTFLDRAKKNLH